MLSIYGLEYLNQSSLGVPSRYSYSKQRMNKVLVNSKFRNLLYKNIDFVRMFTY